MNNENLMQKIETLRKKMIAVGMSEGLTAPETILLSEELDKLLNINRRLLRETQQSKKAL
jgi:hypothetical protein